MLGVSLLRVILNNCVYVQHCGSLTMLEECIQNLIWWPSTINSYIGMVVTWTIIFTNIYYVINFSSNCYSYFSPPADKHANLSDLL